MFRVSFDKRDVFATLAGEARSEVALTYFHVMNWFRRALLAPGEVNYAKCLQM